MDPTVQPLSTDRLVRTTAILERARRLSDAEIARLARAFRGDGRAGEQSQLEIERRQLGPRAVASAIAGSGLSRPARQLQNAAPAAVRSAAERAATAPRLRSLGLLGDAQLAVADAALAVLLEDYLPEEMAELLSGPFREATAPERAVAGSNEKANPRRPPLVERRRTSPLLALYTAASIAAGFAVLAWATATLPLAAPIREPALAPATAGWTPAVGLVFWIALGLLGSARTKAMGGRAVLTFHLPFIVAAMALGGPVAGGWVAAISTFELRELREVPWFGTLANHAVLALSAVVGGLVVAAVRASLGGLDPQVAMLVATLGGAFVFCLVDVGMTIITVGLREGLTPAEAGATFDRSFRQTVGGEVVLGWLLALVYSLVAWWAPIVCVALVLLVWRADDEHEMTRHDPMTGLLNRRGFGERLDVTLARVRRRGQTTALLVLDLDGFKAINDRLGHEAGDEVIRAVGSRLQGAIRFADAAARLGGDEFALLLERVPDVRAATAAAWRIHDRLAEPLQLAAGEARVGASIGLVLLGSLGVPGSYSPPGDGGVLGVADQAMYAAKRGGGGVVLGAPPGARPASRPSALAA